MDDTLAALLLPLEDLDDLALDESLLLDDTLVLDEERPSPPLAPQQTRVHDEEPSSSFVVAKKNKKKKTRPAAYDSNKARTERRRELVSLRQRMTEMQEELARLQAEGRCITSVWKPVASRQFGERQRAEMENMRLRAALDAQLKTARKLESILNRRSLGKTMEVCGLSYYPYAYDRVADRSDGRVFSALLGGMSAIYMDAEKRVGRGKHRSADPVESSHDARMRPAEDGLLVEIFATDLLPFSLSDTSAAAWRYFSHGKNQVADPFRHSYERVGQGTDSNDNTVLERSVFEMAGHGIQSGSKIVVKSTQALQRYNESDCVMIAWNAIMEPVQYGGKPLNGGFSLSEHGCMILRPSGGASPMTVLQSCFFIKSQLQSGVCNGDHSVEIGKLTECVLSWTSSSISAWRQRIENVLLDMHLDGPATGRAPPLQPAASGGMVA